jgi:quinol monooxygenase YgiN
MQANKMVGEIDYEANLCALYYDLAGAHSPEVIRMLLTITTPDHLLYGSDYPYVAPQALIGARKSLEARLASHGLDPHDVFTNNAARLCGAEIPVREYGERIVRLAEIEVYPEKLEEYMTFAKEVGVVSMATEPGVIGLFSMQDKADPCKVYILEVYADRKAYEAHIQTGHFRKYKEGTASMVKSLKLMDTHPLVTAKLFKSAIR